MDEDSIVGFRDLREGRAADSEFSRIEDASRYARGKTSDLGKVSCDQRQRVNPGIVDNFAQGGITGLDHRGFARYRYGLVDSHGSKVKLDLKYFRYPDVDVCVCEEMDGS